MIIVDDEPFIIEGLKHIIDWEEYDIELVGTASNGFEALELIKKTAPNLLITDIKMPKMNGLDLIKKVKELDLNTRFIILSGYDDYEYLKESIKLGIENYLLKPINCEELEDIVENIRNKLDHQNLQNLYSSKDFDIIKNNILYRWVTGSISQTELLERASLLDIRVEYPQYIVCLLRLLQNGDVDSNWNSYGQKAMEICMSATKSFNSVTVFCTPENHIVFITNDLESSYRLARHCIDSLNNFLNVNCLFTIGSIEYDSTLVSRSYYRALELQQYSLIMPANSILEHNNFMNSSMSNRIYGIIDYDEICKLVASKNTDSLISYIDNTFEAIKHVKDVTPESVKNTAAELFFCIINASRQMFEAKCSIHQLDFSFSSIFKMESLDNICEILKINAAKLINAIIEKDNSISPVIKRIFEYVKLNYSKDICLKSMAKDFNSNPNYLGQLFKEETGRYFSDYLNIVRINKAKELLQNTDKNIKDISISVGYKDVNYFYRIFKKYTGISPSEFRNI